MPEVRRILIQAANVDPDRIGCLFGLTVAAQEGRQTITDEQTQEIGIQLAGPGAVNVARAFVSACKEKDGPGLIRIDKKWHRYHKGEWKPESDEERIEQGIRKIIQTGRYEGKNGFTRHEQTSLFTRDCMGALLGEVPIFQRQELPLSLDSSWEFDPLRHVLVKNGILNLETGEFRKRNSSLIALGGLQADWDTSCSPPKEWFAFLRKIAVSDQDIRLLRQWMGYLLTPDTSLQTAMWFIGPPRSGKGTILRVIGWLMGDDLSGALSIQALESRFAFQSLIGKLHVSIGDSVRQERAKGASKSRLLQIIGEDKVLADVKNKDLLQITLPTRISLASNALLALSDQDGAMAARFRFFETSESFVGREDTTLGARLRGELPGILRWAVAGWRDVQRHGFVLNKTTTDMRFRLETTNCLSPQIGAFVEEELNVTGAQEEVMPWSALYSMYETWAKASGERTILSRRELSEQLRRHPKIRPLLDKTGSWPSRRINGKKCRVCPGIGLTLN